MMADEGSDAAVGRVLRERKTVESHLAVLEADARKMSKRLAQLAQLLDEDPQDVWFSGQSANTKGYAPRSSSFNIADFNLQRVVDLTIEIRDTREKLDRLNSEASRLGF
jgi:hypothetical protein